MSYLAILQEDLWPWTPAASEVGGWMWWWVITPEQLFPCLSGQDSFRWLGNSTSS